MHVNQANPYVCLVILVILGTTAVVGTTGIIFISLWNRETPPSLVAIVSVCIGSLSSFLVSVPRGSAGGGQERRHDQVAPQ